VVSQGETPNAGLDFKARQLGHRCNVRLLLCAMDNLAGSKQINRPGSVIWVRHRHFVASAAAAPGFLAGRLRDQEL